MLLTSVLPKINLLAVLVAGVIHMVIGLVWFQRWAFGNAWTRLTGKSLTPAYRWIAAGVIAHQVMTFVLAVIVVLAGATTALGGVVVGVMAWLGFVVTMLVGELIWEKIPFRLFLIRIGNQLVGFIVSGAILAVWR